MARFILPTTMLVAAASALVSTPSFATATTTYLGTPTSTYGGSHSTTPTGPVIMIPEASLTAGLSGSVIAADACSTTYAISCTDAALCLNTAYKVTATLGPSSYAVTYASSTGSYAASITVACAITGSSRATCSDLISATSGSTTAVLATTAVTYMTYFALPVQSGFVAPTGTCSSAPVPTIGPQYTSLLSSKGAAATNAPIYRAGVPILAAAAVLAAL